jgi:hypothetical protein
MRCISSDAICWSALRYELVVGAVWKATEYRRQRYQRAGKRSRVIHGNARASKCRHETKANRIQRNQTTVLVVFFGSDG